MEGFSLGVTMAVCMLIGLGIGVWIDRRLHLETPWFTIVFVLLGLAAALREAFAVAKRLERRDTDGAPPGYQEAEHHDDGDGTG